MLFVFGECVTKILMSFILLLVLPPNLDHLEKKYF